MQRNEAIRTISEHRDELRDKFGVKSIAIFGSTARDEAGPNSDVDVLVEFEQRYTLFHFSRTKFFLEDILHKKVDLAPRKEYISSAA